MKTFSRNIPIFIGFGPPLKLIASTALCGLLLSTANASVEVNEVRLKVDGASDFEAVAPGSTIILDTSASGTVDVSRLLQPGAFTFAASGAGTRLITLAKINSQNKAVKTDRRKL